MKMTKSKIKPKPTNGPKPIDPLQHIHAFCHFVMKKKIPLFSNQCVRVRAAVSSSSHGFRNQKMKTLHYRLCKQIGCENASKTDISIQCSNSIQECKKNTCRLPEQKTTFAAFRGF